MHPGLALRGGHLEERSAAPATGRSSIIPVPCAGRIARNRPWDNLTCGVCPAASYCSGMGSGSSVRQYRLLASTLLVLAVLALCTRLLVPPGYMPSFASEKAYLTLELCSIHAERQTILIDLETGKRLSPADAEDGPGQQDSQQKFQPCPFAAAACAAALALADIPDLASLHWPEAPARAHLLPLTAANAIVLVPWSTGPPPLSL